MRELLYLSALLCGDLHTCLRCHTAAPKGRLVLEVEVLTCWDLW